MKVRKCRKRRLLDKNDAVGYNGKDIEIRRRVSKGNMRRPRRR